MEQGKWSETFVSMKVVQNLVYPSEWVLHLFPTSYARGEKLFGLEQESNPGPLASQATSLATRPCRLGHQNEKLDL